MLPKQFKIAGQEIKVNLLNDCSYDDNFGTFNPVKNEIDIYMYAITDNEKVKLTDEQIKSTYWHEIFHVFCYMWNTETPEDIAQVFSNFMCEYERTKE